MKKVLIAAPIGDGKEYSINEWFDYIVNQDYADVVVVLCVNGKSSETLIEKMNLLSGVELFHKSGVKIPFCVQILPYIESYSLNERLIYSREILREFAVRGDFDYLFFMDTDTIPNRKDALVRLLSHDVDFVSGVYFYKASRQPVIVGLKGVNASHEELQEHYDKNLLMPIWGSGYGCVLMSKKLFSVCPFDWSEHKDDWSDDFAHCEVVEKKGFERFCDAKVFCRHYRSIDFTFMQGSEEFEKDKID